MSNVEFLMSVPEKGNGGEIHLNPVSVYKSF